MYPTANIWIIGHSLGGSLASLLGATFGVPTVAFESPAEKLAASRLHLPSPVRLLDISPVRSTLTTISCYSGIAWWGMECSHRSRTSHMYTTPRIRYPWELVMASHLHALSEGTPLRRRESSSPRHSLPTSRRPTYILVRTIIAVTKVSPSFTTPSRTSRGPSQCGHTASSTSSIISSTRRGHLRSRWAGKSRRQSQR